jgi:hypothetical protein
MKKLLNLQFIIVLLVALTLISSCKKSVVPEPLLDTGSTFVKIINGGTYPTIITKAVDFVSTPGTINLNVQRLVANSTDLAKKMTIKILDDTAAVTFFNRDTVSTNPNASNPDHLYYAPLPAVWYTVGSTTTKAGGSGGVYTMVMNPDEFAKDLQIVIPDATVLDPSTTYGLAFKITSVDADGKIGEAKSCIMTIGAKNKYDGVYTITGSFLDVTNATFVGRYPLEYSLVTTGPSSVDVKMLVNGSLDPAYLFTAGASGSFFGNWGLTMTFNPVTDQIADLHNYYGDPSKAATAVGTPSAGSGAPLYSAANTRRAVTDPSGVNAFSASKVVNIKYFMIQPSSAAGAAPRCYFNETWTYKGPR